MLAEREFFPHDKTFYYIREAARGWAVSANPSQGRWVFEQRNGSVTWLGALHGRLGTIELVRTHSEHSTY